MTMTLDEYVSALDGKRIAVVGIGVSNTPLIRLLVMHGCNITACDKRSEAELGSLYNELTELGVKLKLGDSYLQDLDFDIIFRTPGLHPKALAEAQKNGAFITSEMEAFFSVCPCRIIAVTGSDGKTTTSTLISELLKAEGYNVHLGGNIGMPLLCEAESFKKDDIAVLELSSFQLHSMKCRPDIAVITNLSPNHLDVHPSFEDYEQAKKNIFLMQQPGDKLILNRDNEFTFKYAVEARSEIIWFSRKHLQEKGCCFHDDSIYRNNRSIIAAKDVLLPGIHNIENLMAAFAATEGLVSDETCRSVAMTFGGVAHRLELIRRLNGVRYYNDSIASSPTRTVAGLRSFEKKVILIAGGHDKHVPFDELSQEIIRRVKALFLTGETAEDIENAVKRSSGFNQDKLPVFVIDDFRKAVESAAGYASDGDIVLLSPACSSFDKFKNFVERGDTFRKIIEELE